MAPERVRAAMARDFRKRLLRWFDESARDLPWRATRDPYPIWVSEIMLQQTRVAAVREHYADFLQRFPSLMALALAAEADVLAAWSGLGYYRRARMLHKAAQFVARERMGTLPDTAEELRTLPGVGEYTSAAIASIAFGEAVAVVDGNVERVVMRLAGLAEGDKALKQKIRGMADALLDAERPGDFNQAMMELGATVCLPRNPLCLTCPVSKLCKTRGEHPVTARKPMLSSEVAYALVERQHRGRTQVLVEQRPQSATVMSGMWELPEIDNAKVNESQVKLRLRHSIMQTNYYVRVCSLTKREAEAIGRSKGEQQWVLPDSLRGMALTGLARKVFKRTGLLPVGKVRVSGDRIAEGDDSALI